MSSLAFGKIALAKLQESQYILQHQLKLKIMKDENEAKMKNDCLN